MFVVTRSK